MSWMVQSDNEDSEEAVESPSYGREGIIFLIDSRRDMFVKDLKSLDVNVEDDKEASPCSGFAMGLHCCKEVMIDKIRKSGSCMISVLLFGVRNGDSARKHCVEFQPLSVSSAEKIKNIDATIRSETHNGFADKYGQSRKAKLADAISACISSFHRCPLKLGSKKIVIFTKDDCPDGSSSDRQHQIRKRAVDLRESHIDLELVPIGCEFNVQKFYEELIKTVRNDEYTIMEPINECSDVSDILDCINQEVYKKRTIARVLFNVGSGVSFGVGVYRFSSRSRYVKKEYLSRESNEQIRQVRQDVDNESGAVLRPYQLKKTTNLGSKEIEFSVEELSKNRKVFKPGMTLLGFKPKESWKVEFHYSSFFIYPDEAIVKGSNVFFKALLNRCLARDVVAVCALVLRIGSRPKYALLIPQEEVIRKDSSKQLLPAGFLVYCLPFARMLGNLPVEPCNPTVDEDKMLLVSKIIKKMKIKNYVPEFFENPSTTKLWNDIQALALHQDKPRYFEDTTLVPVDKIKNRLRDLSVQFCDVFSAHDKKRKAVGKDDGASTSKKGKFGKDDGASTSKKGKLVELFGQKMVHKMTVAELKDLLKCVPNVNMKNGKKADLVELVYANADIIKKSSLYSTELL